MRYFRAYCAGDDFRSSNIDSFEYLYEAFGKKAFLCPFRVVGARPTEANGHDAILGVSIVFAETHVDEHMVEEHIQKACCSWGISHPLLLRIEECTFDKCFILHESGYFSYNESELYGIANLFELSVTCVKISDTEVREFTLPFGWLSTQVWFW